MNIRQKVTVAALLTGFALASSPAKADVLGFSVALPEIAAVTAEIGKSIAADVAGYLSSALSAPRMTRKHQSPTRHHRRDGNADDRDGCDGDDHSSWRRAFRRRRPSRSRRTRRARHRPLRPRGCELRIMPGGDEEGVEGWSGTVNQSITSQPSDSNFRFLEANMDRDFNDSQPIYRQLRDRVVAMILDGVLNEGDPLPSVRNVAAEYRVNPLTVLKGYQQLVDEQLVEKKRGRGMFINTGARDMLLQGERQKFLADEWPKIRATIQRLGLEPAALLSAGSGEQGER